MRPLAVFVLVAVACPLSAQSPPPASEPAATSQPAVVIGHYYSLLKNEFMKDKDGRITLLTTDMRVAIATVRQKAQKDKEDIDKQIPELQKQAAADEKAAAAADEKARQARIEGDRKANSQLSRSIDRRGRVSRSGVQSAEKSREAAVADANRLEAEKNKQTSEAHSAKAQVVRLKKQSAELAVVASPYNRNLPPRKYFADQPEDMQEQLRHVGITQDEFKGLLPGINHTETTFLEVASQLDKETRDSVKLRDRLRELFAARYSPASSKPVKATLTKPRPTHGSASAPASTDERPGASPVTPSRQRP